MKNATKTVRCSNGRTRRFRGEAVNDPRPSILLPNGMRVLR